MTAGSRPYRSVQNAWLMRTTGGASGSVSAAMRPRPINGDTPIAGSVVSRMRVSGSSSGSPAPVTMTVLVE